VSVRQSNKILRLIVTSSCVFYLSDCTPMLLFNNTMGMSHLKNYKSLSYFLAHFKVQSGPILRRGYVLEYMVVNRIVVKRILFKWFILR